MKCDVLHLNAEHIAIASVLSLSLFGLFKLHILRGGAEECSSRKTIKKQSSVAVINKREREARKRKTSCDNEALTVERRELCACKNLNYANEMQIYGMIIIVCAEKLRVLPLCCERDDLQEKATFQAKNVNTGTYFLREECFRQGSRNCSGSENLHHLRTSIPFVKHILLRLETCKCWMLKWNFVLVQKF